MVGFLLTLLYGKEVKEVIVSLHLKQCLVCKAWKVFYISRWSYVMNKCIYYRSRLEKAVNGELPIVKERQPSVRFDSNYKYLNLNLKSQFTS